MHLNIADVLFNMIDSSNWPKPERDDRNRRPPSAAKAEQLEAERRSRAHRDIGRW